MKLTKRILAVMLSFLMIIASANIVVLGADEPTITVSDATAKQGDTVDVTVSMAGNPGIISLMLDVEYDTSALTLTGVTDSGVLSGEMHTTKYTSPYRLTWENDTGDDNLMVEGDLATLHFKVNDDAEAGEYPITVSVPKHGILNHEIENVNFALVNGKITVEEAGEEEPVIPEDAAKIVVSNGRGRAGKTVEVTISLENNPGIIAMRLYVEYDNTYITLTDVNDAAVLPGAVHSSEYDRVPYTLLWGDDVAEEDITSNGTIVTLTFEIAENAPADISVPVTVWYELDNYDVYDINSNPVEFQIVDGAVEIIDYICGDVNGDGNVNPLDKTYLARHLAGWPGYTAEDIDMDAADVNEDGKVNPLDKTILARHIANWSEYAELPYVK